MIATSTTWPCPVASALRRAAMTAKLVASAAMPSASPNGGSVGGPSGSPVIAANPLIASAIEPNPGWLAIGPNWPKAVTRAMTRLRVGGEQLGRDRCPSAPACRGGSSRSARRAAPPGAAAAAAPSGRERLMRDRPLVAPERLPPQPDAVLGRPVGAGGVGLAPGARP